MSKCPRCFTALSPSNHLWTLPAQAGGTRYRDDVASAYVGAPAECGPLYTWTRSPGYNGPPPPMSEASRALQGPAVEICPVCHFTLPEGFREGHAICIALAGARATGKSLYIAVLIKQLELLCERFGVVLEPVTRATVQNYATNYEGPLYVQRGLLPPTPTVHTQAPNQREPLVFSLGVWHGVRRFLVLRDVAGEDLENGDLRAPPFQFFGHADAVFFMFDPLRVKAIRDQLQDLLPPQPFSGGEPRSVLGNLLLAVNPGQPKLAVILSKFDVLRALRDVQGSEWALVMSNGERRFCGTPPTASSMTTSTLNCSTRRCGACWSACTVARSCRRWKTRLSVRGWPPGTSRCRHWDIRRPETACTPEVLPRSGVWTRCDG